MDDTEKTIEFPVPVGVAEIPPEDDAEALGYDDIRRKREGGAGDCVTMQTALCLIIATLFVVLNIFSPETAGGLFSKLRELSADSENVVRNPIEIVAEFFGK